MENPALTRSVAMALIPGIVRRIMPATSLSDANLGLPAPETARDGNPAVPIPPGRLLRARPILLDPRRLIPGRPDERRANDATRGPSSPLACPLLRPLPEVPPCAWGPATTNAPISSAASMPAGREAAAVFRPAEAPAVPRPPGTPPSFAFALADLPLRPLRPSVRTATDLPRPRLPDGTAEDVFPEPDVTRAGRPPPLRATVDADAAGPEARTLPAAPEPLATPET